MGNSNAKIMIVDDDPFILVGFRRVLSRHFQLETFTDPLAALAAFEKDGPFAVVVSDLNMPELDGVALLSKVRELDPDTTRIMLTGESDIKSAAAAVNSGHVFRLLTKPCTPRAMAENLLAGMQQYEQVSMQREQAREAIKHGEELYRNLAETLQAGVWQLDSRGRVKYANPRILEFLGLDGADALIGRDRNEFMTEDINILSVDWEEARNHLRTVYETELVGVKGGRMSVMVSSLSIFGADNLNYLIEAMTDISALKKAQRETEEMKRQVALADKMASIGILAAGVAHEINNPNNFIMLNIQTIERVWMELQPLLRERCDADASFGIMGSPYPEAKATMDALFKGVREGAGKIKSIVSSLKDYSRRDPEAMSMEDVNKVVESAMTIMKSYIGKATSRLSVELADPPPVTLCNPQRLEQVVINLLQNACEALRNPGEAIKVVTGQDEQEGVVFIKVSDEGVGISPEDMGRIADPFFTTKRDSGGTGLGLSVSNRIVAEHGGSLEFKSVPGEGASATVSIPLRTSK